MSAISEWIAREYLEMLGYLVSQPCKHNVGKRSKQDEEKAGLLAINPSIPDSDIRMPETMVWTSEGLSGIKSAVVGVCGWHTERIYTASLIHDPEILDFMNNASLRLAEHRLGAPVMAKIICLPQLPVSKRLRGEMLATLKEKGIDGVLLFRTMLLELINRVDAKKNYEKSDLLQIIRILKNYDLLKDLQMELFESGKRNRRNKSIGRT